MFALVLRRPKLPLNCRGVVHQRTAEHIGEPHFHSWGQVVAGSNPVSPTEKIARQRVVSEKSGAAFFIPPEGVDSNADSNVCLVQEAELSSQALNCCPCGVITGVPVNVSGDRRFGCRLTGVSHISNRFRSNLKESKHAISHPHPGASRV